MEPQPQYKNRSKGNQRSICPSCNLSSFFSGMILYNMMLFFKLYFPSCQMVSVDLLKGGSGEGRRRREKMWRGEQMCSWGVCLEFTLGNDGRCMGGWVWRWCRWVYFLAFRAARAASTSSSGCSGCHWAMGRRGLAIMSDQCFSPAPEDLVPTKIFPMASFLPILS